MMFENDLTPDPTFRSQVRDHLPIAALVLGVLGLMVALHVAVAAVMVLAVAHIVVGLGAIALRRHSRGSTA